MAIALIALYIAVADDGLQGIIGTFVFAWIAGLWLGRFAATMRDEQQ